MFPPIPFCLVREATLPPPPQIFISYKYRCIGEPYKELFCHLHSFFGRFLCRVHVLTYLLEAKLHQYSHKICGRARGIFPLFVCAKSRLCLLKNLYHYLHECWTIHLFSTKRQKLSTTRSFVQIPCRASVQCVYCMSWDLG